MSCEIGVTNLFLALALTCCMTLSMWLGLPLILGSLTVVSLLVYLDNLLFRYKLQKERKRKPLVFNVISSPTAWDSNQHYVKNAALNSMPQLCYL